MERFNTSIVCTYNLLKDDDESELCYKIQYLDIFGLKDYDGDIINKVIQDLENKYKDNEYIKREQEAEKRLSSDSVPF